jgi:hypothetical protein
MNQELQKVNQEQVDFISLEEASQQLNMSYKSLAGWLTSHKEIKQKYCFKAHYQGRRRTLIYVEALLVIANVKDSSRGNQNKKILPSENFNQGKQKLAEKVVEQVKASQSLESLYSQAQMLVQTIEGLLNVQVKVENHEERLLTLEGDVDNAPIEVGQRTFLKEFCNRLHFGLKEQGKNVHFSSIRKDLNIAVGKHSVEEYTQADYFRAIATLKRWYKHHNIQW